MILISLLLNLSMFLLSVQSLQSFKKGNVLTKITSVSQLILIFIIWGLTVAGEYYALITYAWMVLSCLLFVTYYLIPTAKN
jgi:hypothetical protein